MPTVYINHRRVNAPIEFKGLKGQYILFAGGAILAALFLFACLYIVGVNSWVCLLLCLGTGVSGISGAYHFSHRYGMYGWRKRRAARRLPKGLRSRSRKLYLQLKK